MSDSTIAFLTVVENDAEAKIGGLLVTSDRGRPIEFHCTEPVAPNRAQQILYGQTLNSYLCGDQIAAALVSKLKIHPGLIITDIPEVLIAREHHASPMVALVDTTTLGSRQLAGPEFHPCRMGPHAVVVNARFPADEGEALNRWPIYEPWIDVEEPLDRIAQRSKKRIERPRERAGAVARAPDEPLSDNVSGLLSPRVRAMHLRVQSVGFGER